jgi:hypothetical protein
MKPDCFRLHPLNDVGTYFLDTLNVFFVVRTFSAGSRIEEFVDLKISVGDRIEFFCRFEDFCRQQNRIFPSS